jgi:hypothetical protein
MSRVLHPRGRVAAGARLAGRARGRRLRIAEVLAAGGEPAEPSFERGGAGQGAGDAREDQREAGGGEGNGDVGEAGKETRVGSVLAQRVGEIDAVGDERAEEGEAPAGTRGQGPIGIELEGIGRCGGCVEHGRNKSTTSLSWARKKCSDAEISSQERRHLRSPPLPLPQGRGFCGRKTRYSAHQLTLLS